VKSSLWRLRRFAWGLWPALGAAALFMGATAGLNTLAVSRTKHVFDPLFNSLGTGTAAQREVLIQTIVYQAEILCLVMIAAGIANAASLLMGDYLGQLILIRLRESVFGHLHDLSMSFFERRRSGELISRVNNDTALLQRALGTELFKMIVAPLTGLFLIGYMIYISWPLTIAMGIVIPVASLMTTVTGYYTRRYNRRVQAKIADLTAVTQESFAAMRVVKTFGLEPQSEGRFLSEAWAVFRAEMKAAFARALGMPPVLAVVGAATAITLVLGAREITQGHLTSADLLVFMLCLQLAGAQLQTTSRLYLTLQQAEAAAERTLAILSETPEVQDAPDAIELEQVQGRITFDHVHFAYDGDHRVLRDFSLEIQPGEVVALAGPSGAGKTTVANLVARLYDVQEGSVLVDGVDVRRVRQASLKRFMGIVPQETVLFGTTIRENIRYGRMDAGEEEIIAAARAASAHDFIMGLPDQYETQVGERGALLSGGQRQRIAIARAFLRNPRILILDEATSALDSESEAAVHAALATLLQGRTALIIAHRLSTIKDADRIVVMADGGIAEQGTHEELLHADGLYRRLYESKELVTDIPEAPGEEASAAGPPPDLEPDAEPGGAERAGRTSTSGGAAS
jgi:subfamily B ATP-binding cassette protein MsbA